MARRFVFLGMPFKHKVFVTGAEFINMQQLSTNDIEGKNLVKLAISVRPWDSPYFRFFGLVRDWAGTLFVLSTAVPMEVEAWGTLLLLIGAVAGDLYVRRIAFDRSIDDLEFSERMIFGGGFPETMGRDDRNRILRTALSALIGVCLAVPISLFLAVQSDVSDTVVYILGEASLILFILSSLGLLLALSRSVEVIPPVGTSEQALDPGNWTTATEFGVGGPFASDALTRKHGAYLRWYGAVLLCCSAFLTLGEKVDFSEIATDGVGKIYGALLAYQFVFVIAGFSVFSMLVLPWKMRGYALISLMQGRVDRFSKGTQRKLDAI